MIKAVITGDVIHSTSMSREQRERLFKQISASLILWGKKFKGLKSEIYRGDSFQCVVKNPADALRIALLIKTYIRGASPNKSFSMIRVRNERIQPPLIFDARIAIGIGAVDIPVRKLATASGEAFQLSGHLLDKMKTTKQAFAIATSDKFNNELEMESRLLDVIISKTSVLQCQVINWKLRDSHTETEIAEQLGIMQSAVNQRSISGNWNIIDTMVKHFEKIYTHG